MKKIILTLFLLLTACSSSKNDQANQQTLTVALKPNITTLYFNGSIEPSGLHAVVSKVDGTIAKMFFQYGTRVTKNQLLFVIETPQLVSDYQGALSDYLKAQYQLTVDTKKLQGSTELHKQGIMSDQDFQSDQSTFYNDTFALIQAKQKLALILEKFDTPPVNMQQLDKLSAADSKHFAETMAQSNTTLEVYAPTTGVAMPGAKDSDTSSDNPDDSNLKPGSSIKAGQSLVVIGERTGIGVSIKVSELNINTIPVNQPVTITGDGFPNITLQGNVSYIERLPVSNNSSGGTPLYLVHVLIPQITPAQRDTIRLGMSARVQIVIKQTPSITVPLTAVFNQNGQNMVKVIDPKTEQAINTPVTTGATTADAVVIQSGLKAGDQIVVDTTATPGN